MVQVQIPIDRDFRSATLELNRSSRLINAQLRIGR